MTRDRLVTLLKPYLLLLPAFLFLGVFTVFPVVWTFVLSFFRWGVLSMEPIFIGLQNYREAFASPVFGRVWRNTIIFSVATVVATVIIGLGLAVVSEGSKVKAKAFFRTAIWYPHVIPWAVAAMVWMWMYQPSRGLINNAFGLDIDWLRSATYALPALIVIAVWKGIGFNFLLYLSGLQSIPDELYDAARLETSSRMRVFRFITLPMLSPTTFVVILLSIIASFQSVDLIYIITQGGPANRTNLMIYYIYQQGISSWRLGFGSALSFVLFFVLLTLTSLYVVYTEKWIHYER